jgi:DNA primase catalytic core
MDRKIIHDVIDATNLVALIEEEVPLKQKGKTWAGRCPFHMERTPSFFVYPAEPGSRPHYHCFGCGASGDAIQWLRERRHISFGQALSILAAAAGITLPQDAMRQTLAPVYRAVEQFADMCASRLESMPSLIAYLRDRGISDAVRNDYKLGWCDQDVMQRAMDRIDPALWHKAGLTSADGKWVCPQRIIFPIHDHHGRIISVTAKTTDPHQRAKWIHGNESDIFKKRHVLYGFHAAKPMISQMGRIPVVEGPIDVLVLQSKGIPAVGMLGVAMSGSSISTLARHGDVVFITDGDKAGVDALDRLVTRSWSAGVEAYWAACPQGQDPDEWILRDEQGFRTAIYQAPLAGQALITLPAPDKSQRLFELTDRLYQHTDPVSQARWAHMVDTHLGLAAGSTLAKISSRLSAQSTSQAQPASAATETQSPSWIILRCAVIDPCSLDHHRDRLFDLQDPLIALALAAERDTTWCERRDALPEHVRALRTWGDMDDLHGDISLLPMIIDECVELLNASVF